MQDSNFSWYPGHIKKAEEDLRKHWLPLVDIVVELVDGRIPISGRYPNQSLWKGKPVLTLFTRRDLCDLKAYPRARQRLVIDNKNPQSWRREVTIQIQSLGNRIQAKLEKQGRRRRLRVGVCGLPNVGKSTFLNGLNGLGRKAKTGKKPGLTRQMQSVEAGDFTILDTPGLMPFAVPKEKSYLLAACGLVPEKLFDPLELAARLQEILKREYSPESLAENIRLYDPEELSLLKAERLIHNFQNGKLGHLNLEKIKPLDLTKKSFET